MSTSGENLDLNLSLNLPLSRMYLEAEARRLVDVQQKQPSSSYSFCKRANPYAFMPPPPPPSRTVESCMINSDGSQNNGVESSVLKLHSVPQNNALSFESGSIRLNGIATLQTPKQEEEAVNITLSTPSSNMVARRGVKSKSGRHAKNVIQETKSEPVDNSNLTSCCRYDSSLSLLTKKFIKLIHEAKDGTLDLNKTADVLEVQKRRIYDITNVLEGTGLIEKTTKNHIRWKGLGIFGPKELDDEVSQLKGEVENLRAQECLLDNLIRDKLEQLKELQSDPKCQKNLFVNEEDITSLQCLKNQTVIAVQAPRASFLEVPDPDEDVGFCEKQCRLVVRSSTGPINVYLLSQNEEKREDTHVKRAKLMDSIMCTRTRTDDAGLSSKLPDDSMRSEISGVFRIIPMDGGVDDDYWLRSDHEVSLSDLWSNSDL